MRIEYTRAALDAVESAPASIRKAFWKQMGLLEGNLLHPGLRAKKFDARTDTWQARVNQGWRFYFRIAQGTIIILDVMAHPK